MKKQSITLLLAFAGIAASAQTMQDAIGVSESLYYGTARTIGMGNAVTAIGSDLGSIAFNPAGSAVAGYSQVLFSPGLSISSNSAAFAGDYVLNTESISYGDPSLSTKTRFVVPSGGFSIRLSTGNYGLKSVTFSFMSHLTNNYLNKYSSSGLSDLTSITGAFAADANWTEMPGDIIGGSSPFGSNYHWNDICAYFAKMINYNAETGQYFGSATGQGSPFAMGDLRQTSGGEKYGTKNDLIFNIGFNIDDKVYLGATLGAPCVNYTYNEEFREAAVNEQDFPITPMDYKTIEESTFYSSSRYNYSYVTNMSGIYGKFGIIWLPTAGLRVGAAVKTPTRFSIRERWQISCATDFKNQKQSASWSSPEGSYSYYLRSPYEINAGIAYTFGKLATVSADYEMSDFSTCKYFTTSTLQNEFEQVNTINKLFCGVSHSLRVGAEFNYKSLLFFRIGYNFTTSPEKEYTNEKGETVKAGDYIANWGDYQSGKSTISGGHFIGKMNHSISAGLGFASRGPFFADFAVRCNRYPTTYYAPYSDYIYADNVNPTVVSPTVSLTKYLWDIVLTLGLRF